MISIFNDITYLCSYLCHKYDDASGHSRRKSAPGRNLWHTCRRFCSRQKWSWWWSLADGRSGNVTILLRPAAFMHSLQVWNVIPYSTHMAGASAIDRSIVERIHTSLSSLSCLKCRACPNYSFVIINMIIDKFRFAFQIDAFISFRCMDIYACEYIIWMHDEVGVQIYLLLMAWRIMASSLLFQIMSCVIASPGHWSTLRMLIPVTFWAVHRSPSDTFHYVRGTGIKFCLFWDLRKHASNDLFHPAFFNAVINYPFLLLYYSIYIELR